VRRIRRVFWIAGVVLLAAAFVLLLHLSTNNMEFSRYNTGWNGTSTFFSDLDRHKTIDVYEPGKLATSPANSTLLLIAPKRDPTAQELAAYTAFLDKGNTLFLADDFGTGNKILTGVDSRVTILPGSLSSLDRRYADPYSVVAYRSIENGSITVPASVALNRPAALDRGTPLMMSSVMSWIDANGNRRLNRGEEMGTFPVLVSEQRGRGRVIVLSDPSILINSMYTQDENADDRSLIRAFTGVNGTLYVDQMNSRTADAAGLSEILHVIRTTIIIEIILLCLLMLALAWAWKKMMI